LNQLASFFISSNNSDSAYVYATRAQQLGHGLKDVRDVARSLVIECVCLTKKGNFSAGLELGLRGLRQFEDLGQEDGMAYACMQIAETYKEFAGDKRMDEYLRKGLVYSNRAIGLYRSTKDTAILSEALNESGIIYHDLAQLKGNERYFDSAYLCYAAGLGLVEKSGKGSKGLGRLYNNISEYYSDYKKDYPTALQYLQKAAAFNEPRKNYKSLTYTYENMADVYSKMGDNARSVEYAQKTLVLARGLHFPERIENAYVQLTRSFKEAGRYDSAFYYLTLYHELSDSLVNLDKNSQIAEMQTRYETVKKENEIQRLDGENKGKSRQIWLLVGGLTTAILIAAFTIWMYRRVTRQKRVISRQSKQLETMMKELHHRVKNNLQIVSSLLSLQSYRLTDEEALAAIGQSQQRVQAMGLIHQRLYKTEEAAFVNIKEYLTDLTESLLSSYGYDRDRFELQISAERELVDVDKVLLLGLIANEIITNALKYAYPGIDRPALDINCGGDEEAIVLSIRDNGRGLDIDRWKEEGDSFGRELVATLCGQLRASQELKVDKGTQFTFIIPRQAQIA
jgi:two-component sensor histidine kinase